MNRLFKLSLAVAVGLFFVGCYNDFDNPKPAKIYTDDDFSEQTYWSVKELKTKFRAANPAMNDGSVASMVVEQDAYIRGKVISNDLFGNVYKSLYIYDDESKSAIELRLNVSNYLFHPVGQIVFVKLKGLVVGNYRGMISVGTFSNDPAKYSNGPISSRIMLEEHIFQGVQEKMTGADTLVVTSGDYTAKLSDEALGRLVRFVGTKSEWGATQWGYKNTFPNYFANSASFDKNSGEWWADFIQPDKATWALRRREPMGSSFTEVSYYGSALFSYTGLGATSPQGNYVIRTSAYCMFRDNKIPESGKEVTITAIYTKYTGPAGQNPTYQLVLNTDKDVIVR